jgi:hypothetical protein
MRVLNRERLLNWIEDVCERIAAALALARQRERAQREQDEREEFARQLRRRRVWFPGDF